MTILSELQAQIFLLELYFYWNYIFTGIIFLLELYFYWNYIFTGITFLLELHFYYKSR
jgi:hypothetical protein